MLIPAHHCGPDEQSIHARSIGYTGGIKECGLYPFVTLLGVA
jgi:hypothetical protein